MIKKEGCEKIFSFPLVYEIFSMPSDNKEHHRALFIQHRTSLLFLRTVCIIRKADTLLMAISQPLYSFFNTFTISPM